MLRSLGGQLNLEGNNKLGKEVASWDLYEGKCTTLLKDRLIPAAHICNYKLNLNFRRQVTIQT